MIDAIAKQRAEFPEAAFHYEVRGLLDEWADEPYGRRIESVAHEIIALAQSAVEARRDLDAERKRAELPDNVRALDALRRHSDPTIRPEGCA